MSNWMIMHTNHRGEESGTGVIRQELRMHMKTWRESAMCSQRCKEGGRRGGEAFMIFWKKEGCKGESMWMRESSRKGEPQEKVACVGQRKGRQWIEFQGKKSARTASCREMANTYRNSKGKKMLQENPRIEFPLTAHKEALLPIDLLPLISQQ